MNSKRTNTRKNYKNFNVLYDSTRVNGNQLTKSQTSAEPTITFNPKKGKYYSIIMYDLHSPKPAYLHYLAINVNNISNILPIVPYQPPSPPPLDTHYHVYLFELYEQPGFLTISPSSITVTGFDPNDFVRQNKLHKLAKRGFYMNPRL
jgi:phosphatidylethanolamine-binding protein (PEBP) family uncharacterized protein